MKTIIAPKVRNMESPRSGNPVANQFIIEHGNTETFQSYKSIIAVKKEGKVFLDETYWDYSVTTSRYLYQFLGVDGGKKTVLAGIDSGKYLLTNLN